MHNNCLHCKINNSICNVSSAFKNLSERRVINISGPQQTSAWMHPNAADPSKQTNDAAKDSGRNFTTSAVRLHPLNANHLTNTPELRKMVQAWKQTAALWGIPMASWDCWANEEQKHLEVYEMWFSQMGGAGCDAIHPLVCVEPIQNHLFFFFSSVVTFLWHHQTRPFPKQDN